MEICIMAESKNNRDKKRENVFEILDGIMFQLNRTKKMFLIMILTILIIPPLAILITVNVLDSPFDVRLEEHRELRQELGLPVSEELTEEQKLLLEQKFKDRHGGLFFFRGPQFVIFVIALVWLGIGIRQWTVLSKWSKKYENFKKQQEEIDKKLKDEEDSDNANS